MTDVIDRRKNGKGKSTGNRQKFIKRSRDLIKKAVREAIDKKQITDILGPDGEVKIPQKGISEPHFRHGEGGDRTYILPGNKDKSVGDLIEKPKSGGGSGGTEGAPDGEGEDDFTFNLTLEEFLDFFFDDLELPDLVKKQLKDMDAYKWARSGFTTSGMPANLSVIRSMRNALGRQIALQSPYFEEMEELQKKMDSGEYDDEIEELEELYRTAKEHYDSVPFIDDIDIRYNSFQKKPNPSTKAVMFCVMDVSGSMGDYEKSLSKRFFMLLYVFLKRHYQKIEVIFIRHHSSAKECTEHEFFYDRESGGTVVSTALTLLADIIKKRYNTRDWNIYVAQASDGDNFYDDPVAPIMAEHILPFVQYFAYVQIGRDKIYSSFFSDFESDKPLWNDYIKLTDKFKNFAMDQIDEPKDIYPVFRKLFKKKEAE